MTVQFAEGEERLTECGFAERAWWTDSDERFALVLADAVRFLPFSALLTSDRTRRILHLLGPKHTTEHCAAGGVVIDLEVPFLKQSYEFDCWFASLRMLVKFRDGANAEPVGHPTAELEGVTRQSKRTAVREKGKSEGLDPRSYAVRSKLELDPSRGLNADEFTQLAGYNGLAAPLLPPRDTRAATGGWTSDQLESLLRIHGPLWCAFGYGHIAVLKGIDTQGNAIVHDPQGKPDTPYSMNNFNRLLTWQPNSIMYLPDVPNKAAYDPT